MNETIRNLEAQVPKKELRFITHAGIFHADEVFATAILNRAFGNHPVERVFNVNWDELMGQDVIVYDIGCGPLDHHQKGGNGVRENGIPYAACGLVWKNYGLDLCHGNYAVWENIDKMLIQGIDANDNGIDLVRDERCVPMNVSGIISLFNLIWDSEESNDKAFVHAVAFAEVVFDNLLKREMSKVKAKASVEDCIKYANDDIVILPQFMPWHLHILNAEGELKEKADKIKYVIYPSKRGGYQWQVVPLAVGDFAPRYYCPKHWRGLPMADLREKMHIATAKFIHPAGFTGSAETFDDCVAMVKLILKLGSEREEDLAN